MSNAGPFKVSAHFSEFLMFSVQKGLETCSDVYLISIYNLYILTGEETIQKHRNFLYFCFSVENIFSVLKTTLTSIISNETCKFKKKYKKNVFSYTVLR